MNDKIKKVIKMSLLLGGVLTFLIMPFAGAESRREIKTIEMSQLETPVEDGLKTKIFTVKDDDFN